MDPTPAEMIVTAEPHLSVHPGADAELRLLKELALAIGTAEDLDTALGGALAMICRVTGWTVGESWLPDPSATRLCRGPAWTGDAQVAHEFLGASRVLGFSLGEGLPGRVWRSRGPIWITDVMHDRDFVRVDAAERCALNTAFAIPVLHGADVVAVIGFFHKEEREEDADLVELVAAAAAQLGALIRRKQAEDALVRHAEELARSNAELERYAYAASHDLQEPLRMVASYVQLLERNYGSALDNDAREIIGFAVEGVTRMRQQILDLLALSAVRRPASSPVPIDLGAVLRRKVAEMRPQIEVLDAVITWDPLPHLPVDRSHIAQVFERLLDNALKFSGTEPPLIHVSARREADAWIFSVRDNGMGIAPEYQERIFVMFQRLNPRDEFPGTGMGLPIVRKIMEVQGGRVWVESTPGRGSTFHFSLPVVSSHAPRSGVA